MTGGISVKLSPIRAFYLLTPATTSKVETGFSVTRNIRGASSRNYIKRRLKESFRKNNRILFSHPGVQGSLKLVLLYTKKATNVRKEIRYEDIKRSVETVLSTVRNQLADRK